MSPQLMAELLEHRRRERERCLREGKELPEWVFASEAGTMLDDANVRHVYGRIVTTAGLRYRSSMRFGTPLLLSCPGAVRHSSGCAT
jgi:hypothetical protein